jgi:hypothetical protein
MKANGLDFLVSHAHVALHNLSNQILCVLLRTPGVEFFRDCRCRVNYYLIGSQLFDLLFDIISFGICLSFFEISSVRRLGFLATIFTSAEMAAGVTRKCLATTIYYSF